MTIQESWLNAFSKDKDKEACMGLLVMSKQSRGYKMTLLSDEFVTEKSDKL